MSGKVPEPPVRLVVRRSYALPAERVFDAWLNPEMARRFLFVTPDGAMQKAEIDPVVGGKFLFVERRGDIDAAHYGVFLELERPRRIAFSFSVEDYDVNAAQVTIDITPRGAGCELVLTQEMAAEWAAYKEKTIEGWTMILGGLERLFDANPN